MKKTLLTLFVVLGVFSMVSCAPPPSKEFKTVEELQEALKDNPEIIFPDLSNYQFDESGYYVLDLRLKNRKTPGGYYVSGFFYQNSNSHLSWLSVNCFIVKYHTESGTVVEPLELNAEYFGKKCMRE